MVAFNLDFLTVNSSEENEHELYEYGKKVLCISEMESDFQRDKPLRIIP